MKQQQHLLVTESPGLLTARSSVRFVVAQLSQSVQWFLFDELSRQVGLAAVGRGAAHDGRLSAAEDAKGRAGAS